MDADLKALYSDSRFEDILSLEPVTCFQLGGLSYQLHLKDSRNEEQLNQWYAGFQTSDTHPPIRLSYLGEEDMGAELFNRLLEDAPLYRDVKVVSSHYLLDRDDFAIFRWDFRAIVNRRTRVAKVYLINASPESVDAIARVAGSLIYAELNCFLIHGSSIEHNGMGYLFTGVSGSGKSTIAELSGAQVLNDEISLIMLEDDGLVYVHGTPFYGDLKQGANIKVPLAGMFLIKQSESTFIEPLDPLKQNLILMRNTIFFQSDLESFDCIQSLIGEVLNFRQLQILNFKKDNTFMEVLP